MATILKAYYNAPEGQIHYRYVLSASTTKKAPMIFMHQVASSSRMWETMMKEYSLRGHDCYAPDMPGFGGSFDPVENPKNTRYYVDIFMALFAAVVGADTKVHLLGHHTGAGLSIEMAATFPEKILSIALSGPAFMTPEEQEASYQVLCVGAFSKPEEDGGHLSRVWSRIHGELFPSLDVRMGECIDNWRAWKGRDQAYACTFRQDKIGFFKEVRCPVLGMCAKSDVLWDYFHYCKEIVSLSCF